MRKFEVGTVVSVNFKGEVKKGVIVSLEKIYSEWDSNEGFVKGGLKILGGSISNIQHNYFIKGDVLTVQERDNYIARYKVSGFLYTISSNGYMLGVPEGNIISVIKTKEENLKNLLLNIKISEISIDDEGKFLKEISNMKTSNIEISSISEIKDKVISLLKNNDLNIKDFYISNGVLTRKEGNTKTNVLIDINGISTDYLLGDCQLNSEFLKYLFIDLKVNDLYRTSLSMEFRDVLNMLKIKKLSI